jgi:hypothetical protein
MKRLAFYLLPLLLASCAGYSLGPMNSSHELRFRTVVLKSMPSLSARLHVSVLNDPAGKPLAILEVDGTLAESEELCNAVLTSLRGQDFSADFSDINIKARHLQITYGDINLKVAMPNTPAAKGKAPNTSFGYADAGSLKGAVESHDKKIYYSLVIGAKELNRGGMPKIIIKGGKYVATGEEA